MRWLIRFVAIASTLSGLIVVGIFLWLPEVLGKFAASYLIIGIGFASPYVLGGAFVLLKRLFRFALDD
jgi:hypothetical protein